MKGIFTKIEDGKILVSLNKEFYEKSAVFAAAHKLSGRFGVLIEPLDERTVGVYLQPKPGNEMNEGDLNEAAFDFCNEVLDQQIRLDLESRYGVIREIIVKQAFAPVSLAELTEVLGKEPNDK